jgi:hypothetical protein
MSRPEGDFERFLVVVDDQEMMSVLSGQIIKILEQMKLAYDVISIENFRQITMEYPYIIMAVTEMGSFDDYEGFSEFLDQGGKIFFPYALSFDNSSSSFPRRLGITEYGEFDNAVGLVFKESFMLGSSALEEDMVSDIQNVSLSLQLEADVEELIKSQNDFTLSWRYPVGQGALIYFNGTMLTNFENQGLLTALINHMRDVKIYPILNGHVNLIHNYPSPIASGNHSETDVYKRSILRFYKEIWLQDLLEIKSRFGLKYTTGLIGTPDVFVGEDTSYFFIKRETLSAFGREILLNDGEIGLTGFNSRPLNGMYWENLSDMIAGLDMIQSEFEKVFTNYEMNSFISKSNRMDPEILKHLVEEGFLIFTSNAEEYPDVLEGRIRVGEGYLELPIYSKGYEDNYWALTNHLAAQGLITHAIGFDDLFNPEKIEASWKDMYEAFYDQKKYISEHFDFLESMTVSEAGNALLSYLNVYPEYTVETNRVTITSHNKSDQPVYYLFSTERQFEVEGGSAMMVDENIYLLRAYEEIMTIQY